MSAFRHLNAEDYESMLKGQANPDVWNHLQSCTQCRTIWEEIYLAHHTLTNAPEVAAPAHLLDQVMTAIHALPQPEQSRKRVWRLLGLAIGIGLYSWFSLWGAVIGYMFTRYVPITPFYTGFQGILALLSAFWWNWRHALSVFLRVATSKPWTMYTLLSFALSLVLLVGLTRYYHRRLFVHANG